MMAVVQCKRPAWAESSLSVCVPVCLTILGSCTFMGALFMCLCLYTPGQEFPSPALHNIAVHMDSLDDKMWLQYMN